MSNETEHEIRMQEQIQAVQRMQDYIGEHIYEEITLADLADISFFSPWYAFRLFKEYTNETPADYIRRYKLSKSALLLRDEKYKIIDIAYQMGFKSVDGYQRAFLKEFGCNPREYAKNPIPLYLFTPYGTLDRTYERRPERMEKNSHVFIQVIHKPKRKVIIKRGIKAEDYFEYCEEVGCDVWGLLTSIRSISGEPVCLWLPVEYRRPDTSRYVQGVEVNVDYYGIIPEGFEVIELPESDFLMFQGEPFLEENYGQAILDLEETLDNYDPSIIGYRYKKSGIRIQLEPIGSRGYIEMMEIEQK